MKSLTNIARTQLNNDKLMMLLDTYEEKGREFYYDMLFEKDADIIFRNTIEEDFYHIGLFYKFDFTDHKLKQWSKKEFIAKNLEEEQFNNYKNIVRRIRNNSKRFELYSSQVVDLSKIMAKNVRSITVNSVDAIVKDILNPNGKTRKTLFLDDLIALYEKEMRANNHEKIAIIINFYIDFINMDVFSYYNEEIGLMLLYALLLKHFNVFKYVSFFKFLYQKQSVFNQAILEANYNWSEGYSSNQRLYVLILEILQEGYLELKTLAHRYEFERDLAKGDHVEGTILKGSEIFTKQDVREKNPLVSDSTIERVLRKLRDDGIIRPLGTGRSASWQLIKNNDDFKLTQLDLFSETDFE